MQGCPRSTGIRKKKTLEGRRRRAVYQQDAKDRLNDLEVQIGIRSGELQTIKDEICAVNDKLSNRQSHLNDIENKIDAKSIELETLNNKISTTQSKILTQDEIKTKSKRSRSRDHKKLEGN